MLKMPKTHKHTHTLLTFLYLRSAGPLCIVIGLCWQAVWGFLSTESSLCILLQKTEHPPHWRDAHAMCPCVLISIFILYISYDLTCTRKRKEGAQGATSLIQTTVPKLLTPSPHLEYKVGSRRSRERWLRYTHQHTNNLICFLFINTK